ncbi:unnamed protein product [Symbiodinium sp. CCMP2592]|nr:unnamed protein product [Symbiodinium sp. CCMP2592]
MGAFSEWRLGAALARPITSALGLPPWPSDFRSPSLLNALGSDVESPPLPQCSGGADGSQRATPEAALPHCSHDFAMMQCEHNELHALARVRCALTPSVVAPWLLPAEREPQMERGRRGQGEEKKDAQRHLQLFGIPNLELTSHKGSRQGLRHSISLDVLAVSPKANSAISEKTPKKRESCPQAIAPEFYAQPPRPTRGLPIKANFARLTGPALRALAEAEVVEISEASRELPLPRVSRTRVSFKPPSRALEMQDPSKPSDLTKTSAQSLTTAASHGASQASLASTGSLHEASPVETSPLAGTSPLAETSDVS